jgi:hypothetical protein
MKTLHDPYTQEWVSYFLSWSFYYYFLDKESTRFLVSNVIFVIL